ERVEVEFRMGWHRRRQAPGLLEPRQLLAIRLGERPPLGNRILLRRRRPALQVAEEYRWIHGPPGPRGADRAPTCYRRMTPPGPYISANGSARGPGEARPARRLKRASSRALGAARRGRGPCSSPRPSR